MSNIARKKWLILIIIIVLFVIFDGLVNNVSIVERGIAIGLAIDLENDKVIMTAQFILPKNGGVSSGGNSFATYTAIGDTVHEALNAVGKKLGSQVSLSHTSILLVNKSVVERGKTKIMEYFLTDAELTDTCFIAATENKAAEFLNATVAFGETPSYLLQRIFKPVRPSIGVCPVTLKDFFVRYYADNPGMYLPIVYTEKGLPNSDQSGNGATQAQIFKADRTLIFNKRSTVGTLSNDATKGLSILSQSIADGAVTVGGRDGDTATIKILESERKFNYDAELKKVGTELNLKVMRVAGAKDGDGKLEFKMDDVEKSRFKQKVSGYVEAAFSESQELDVDLFMAYRGFYRDKGADFLKKSGDDYLKSTSLTVDINLRER